MFGRVLILGKNATMLQALMLGTNIKFTPEAVQRNSCLH